MTLDVYAHVYEEWEGKTIVLEEQIRLARGETGPSRAVAP